MFLFLEATLQQRPRNSKFEFRAHRPAPKQAFYSKATKKLTETLFNYSFQQELIYHGLREFILKSKFKDFKEKSIHKVSNASSSMKRSQKKIRSLYLNNNKGSSGRNGACCACQRALAGLAGFPNRHFGEFLIPGPPGPEVPWIIGSSTDPWGYLLSKSVSETK